MSAEAWTSREQSRRDWLEAADGSIYQLMDESREVRA